MEKRETILIVIIIFITYFLGLFIGYKMKSIQDENNIEYQQEETVDAEDYASNV